MACHNEAMLKGYLLKHPKIKEGSDPDDVKAYFTIRTIRRDSDVAGTEHFENVPCLYEGNTPLMDKIRNLVQFDLIEIKGVFNMIVANKPHRCPDCGNIDIKEQGSFPFIYPIHLVKIDNVRNSFLHKADLPDAILSKYYKEVSNFMWALGTVCTKPEMIAPEGNRPICRYMLGINRKYYVPTQPDTRSDYPWVYSFGEQAEKDMRHLEVGSEIFIDGYFHAENIAVRTKCSNCGADYSYPDLRMDFIPYATEYLVYKTDLDIAREEELAKRGLSGEGDDAESKAED